MNFSYEQISSQIEKKTADRQPEKSPKKTRSTKSKMTSRMQLSLNSMNEIKKTMIRPTKASAIASRLLKTIDSINKDLSISSKK